MATPRAFQWGGDTGSAWRRHADGLERQLEPVHGPLFAAAALDAGARVLDVGCGRGATARVAARAVGPSGHVTGIDLSADLLADARVLAEAEGLVDLAWLCADAEQYEHPAGAYDVVLSRFGVMFFADPVAAFTQLRRATRDGGRLAVAVWQPEDRSPLHHVVAQAAAAGAARVGATLDDGAAHDRLGRFADASFLTELGARSGWGAVTVAPVVVPMYVGGAGASVEAAVALRTEVGPLALSLADATPEVRTAVVAAVTEAFRARHDGTGVQVDGGIAIVTATAV